MLSGLPGTIAIVFLFSMCCPVCLLAQADPPPGVPKVATVCDTIPPYTACADWKWNGTDFDYAYSKASGKGTITRNGTGLVLTRTDTHASWPVKVADVEYVGSVDSDHSARGTSKYVVKGGAPIMGTWTASFVPMKPVEGVLVEPVLGPPPPPGTPPLAVPPGFEECEGECIKAHNGNIGAWIFRGTKGDAIWTLGNKATLTVVRYDVNGVIIRRDDLATSKAAGQTAVYTGRLSEGRMEGTATLNWIGPNSQPMSKHIPWFATIPVTSCDPSISAEEAMQFGGQAAAFRQMPSAFQCFKVAASQGDGRAKTLVGLMYRDGKGVTSDMTEATRWLKAGAIQGDHDAQLALQQMYEIGVGTAADPVQAKIWKHAAETNPKVLEQQKWEQDGKETRQLMMMGVMAILSRPVFCCM